jgi:glucose/arabinose dehydrogenase
VPPAQNLVAHSAPLGISFLRQADVPLPYKNKLLIAEHGSWNRTVPVGYRISMVDIDEDEATNYSVFAEGWLEGEEKYGRPVDIALYTDGSLLVSDDYHHALYRISFVGKK